MINNGWDVIGDIHGHADALKRLLSKLGYRRDGGIYRHESRRLIFLGDYIDRGPSHSECLHLVRSMCDGASAFALLGNHEFNAVGWARGFKPVKPSHERQRAEFLRQIGNESPEYWSAIEWFESLPIRLDLDGLSLVHACWHEASFRSLSPFLSDRNSLTREGWREVYRQNTLAYEAAEIVLKGPELELPVGAHFFDKDGNRRHHKRIDWWQEQSAGGSYWSNNPILFGHYWLTESPRLLDKRASCLDFSVAAGGYLTCYRWSGERTLTADNLVYVKAN